MPEQPTYPQPPPPPYYQDDEITLKELILKLRKFASELWHSKLLLLGIIFLGVAGFVAKSYLTDTSYDASMSFLVAGNNASKTRVMTDFGPLEFGSVESNKITELARSGRIIHQVLLSRKIIDDEYDYLVNHLIDIYDYHDKWEEEPLVDEFKHLHLADFYFTKDSIPVFSQKEYRALNLLHVLIAGNKLVGKKGIMSINYNDDTDIFRLDIKALHKSLSLTLLKAVFDELRSFYTEETVGRTNDIYELVKNETDSLNLVLSAQERIVAGASDRDRGFTSTLPGLRKLKLQRELSEIQVNYEESLRSQKSLELLLRQDTPEFQIIDQTFLPVENSPSKIKACILGGFLGLFLGGIWIVGRKIIRDAMAS